MKITKTKLIIVGAILITPLLFSSCSHPVAAGAATAAAYDNRQDEQRKEDYAKVKKEQVERRADR